MIEEGIYTYLTGQTALTTHVSTRIYPQRAKQTDQRPYIVYARFGGEPVYEMHGETGLSSGRYRFMTVGDTYASAKTVANALRGELSGYRGAMGSDFVSACFLTNESDDFIQDPHGGEQGFHEIVSDYEFHYQQTVPTFSS